MMKLTGERPMQVTESVAFSYKLLLLVGGTSTVLLLHVVDIYFCVCWFWSVLPLVSLVTPELWLSEKQWHTCGDKVLSLALSSG